jgi:hypothetical protein
MNTLGKVFHKLRVWIGLADASESHITPSHGWLLAEPVAARQQRGALEAERAARLRNRGDRA